LKNIFYLIILAIFSLFANQYIANRGAFPIDSFLIFDAAYNIISGNHPFKDYWLITGPFLDYIQALFFLIFGINWTSYVLHGSVINVLLAIFSFYLFLNIGLKNYYAFVYSISISLLAYPSIGAPFIDHHAVIFCIIACYSISLGILSNKNIFWFLVPIFITFSFLSKQIPSPYFVLLFTIIILIYFYYLKNINKNILINLLIGSFLSFALVIFIFIVNKIPVQNFLTQYIYYPFSLGDSRISRLEINFNNLIGQFKFIYLMLIPLVISTFFLAKIKKKNLIQKKELVVSFLFLGSIGILIYCQLLTKNQVLIFFLIPICAAYSHSYTKKYFNKIYLVYFILLIFIFTTVKYHLRYNQDRKFIELVNANFSLSEDASKIDKSLSGLKWITPHYLYSPSDEIDLLIDTKNILLKAKKKKIIITDYQFFSSIINNKFASPNKWYDDLSIPKKDSKYYDTHKNFFLDKIVKNKIKYLYFIGKSKNEMYFFKEFIGENKCIIPNQLNELLLEFDINQCEF
jgi:hypothetical protein